MKHYTRLKMSERCLIATFMSMNAKVSTIAERSGRHRSTIYRELKRNKPGQLYMPALAHGLAKKRHPRPENKLDTDPNLHKYVLSALEKGWSPQQISGRMRLLNKEFFVCPESIYRYLYRDKKSALYKLLPRKRPNRYSRSKRKVNQKAQLLKRNIRYRPNEVNLRNTLGHWEGDTIRFPLGQKTCVTTLVERKSRFVCLRKNEDKKSPTIIEHVYKAIQSSPKRIWLSLTLDQGSEFMGYQKIERKTRCKIYFCSPRSPWQRGSNENMNGRLRRFLPKKLNIDETTQGILDNIAVQVNNTPRKCLGYQTPREVFMQDWKTFCRTAL